MPENANFITLEPENNDESTRVITLTPTANATAEPRTATITLITTEHEGTPDSVSLTIIQRGVPPTLMLTSHTDGDSIAIIHDDTNPITISFTFGGSEASSMSTISYMPENANFITLEPENK